MGSIRQEAFEVYYSLRMLCFALSAVFGLVGALRIYSLWNIHGKHHIQIDAQVIGWIGAAIFFECANLFIKVVLL
jgi:Domain of unknown function (DUF4134)